MLWVYHYVTKNRVRSLAIILIAFVLLLFLWVMDFPCLWKTVFNFPCPACGMTRGMLALFNLDFAAAFHYNILVIPLFLLGLYGFFLIINDLIRGKNVFEQFLLKFFAKYYILIIGLLLVSWVLNIYKGI